MEIEVKKKMRNTQKIKDRGWTIYHQCKYGR